MAGGSNAPIPQRSGEIRGRLPGAHPADPLSLDHAYPPFLSQFGLGLLQLRR